MDAGEGSYGQIFDHFGTKAAVDEILLATQFVFITHIHGDHQLGILKIMLERDRLLTGLDLENKLYVMTPTPMMEWMKLFVSDSLKYPQMVVLVPSSSLNPEKVYYYQEVSEYATRSMPQLLDMPQGQEVVRTKEEMQSII